LQNTQLRVSEPLHWAHIVRPCRLMAAQPGHVTPGVVPGYPARQKGHAARPGTGAAPQVWQS
jgi:hypothetical protein